MKGLDAIAAIFTLAVTLTTSLARPLSNDKDQVPPLPALGESVDEWLDSLFGPDNFSSPPNSIPPIMKDRTMEPAETSKRAFSVSNYKEYYGIHELSWTNETEKTGYNLTVDFSKSCTGLKLTTDVGVYTFTNGTTTHMTQLKDLIIDVWSLAPSAADSSRRWENHTAALTQLARNEANTYLASSLRYQNKTMTATSVDTSLERYDTELHTELRHLLASDWSYWTSSIISTALGAVAGAGIAAATDRAFNGVIRPENIVQTALVISTVVLFGAIMARLHDNGDLDWAGGVAARRRQAVVQNVQIAFWRGAVERAARMSMDVNPDLDASQDAGTATPRTGSYLTTADDSPVRNPGQSMPLSNQQLAQAMLSMGGTRDEYLRLWMMNSIEEAEAERMERGEAGFWGSRPSQSGPSHSRPSQSGLSGSRKGKSSSCL